MSSPLSLREFSRRTGLSPSTISRAFNQPEIVSAETLARVKDLAAKTGFRPSPVARASVGATTKSIGVLLPDLSISFFADVARGIQSTLLSENFLPVVLTNNDNEGLSGIQRLVDHRVDGLIFGVSDGAIRQEEVTAITGTRFPLVMIDHPYPHFQCDCVLNDDENGGYQVGRHLIQLGHRNFCAIRYGAGDTNCEQRLSGFQRALKESGYSLSENNIARAETIGDMKPLVSQLKKILSRKPTAIFATTDLHARFVYQLVHTMGLSIPNDLSVAGFADLGYAELMNPPLTTVRQNGELLGKEAADLILRRLSTPERRYIKAIIPTELVIRSSTTSAIPAKSRQTL